MYSRRSLQSGGKRKGQNDDEREKAERLLKRLEEKDSKMRKKWVDAAAKIAGAWRKEGKLKPLGKRERVGTRLNSLSCYVL
jgi:hypothetical protein